MKEQAPVPVENSASLDSEKKPNPRLELAQKTIERTGLYDDVKAVWNSLAELSKVINGGDTEYIKMMIPIALGKPFQNYEEYLNSSHIDQELAAYAKEHSDAEKVEEFDGLIALANVIRDQILGVSPSLDAIDTQASRQTEERTEIIDPDSDQDSQIAALRDLLEVRNRAMTLLASAKK